MFLSRMLHYYVFIIIIILLITFIILLLYIEMRFSFILFFYIYSILNCILN